MSERRRDEADARADTEPLCKCGRAPRRKGQRNCIECNREANRKYRAALKRQQAAIRRKLTRM